jgi:hypothetical protein
MCCTTVRQSDQSTEKIYIISEDEVDDLILVASWKSSTVLQLATHALLSALLKGGTNFTVVRFTFNGSCEASLNSSTSCCNIGIR